MTVQPFHKVIKPMLLVVLFSLSSHSLTRGQHGGKAEPLRIEFKRGTNSTIIGGSVRGSEQAEYVLAARKGQTLIIKLTSVPRRSSVFQIIGPDNDTLGLEYDANWDYNGK